MTAAAEPQELLMKLLDPAIRANPYPVYREILDGGPMQMPESTLHVLSSFADCDEVLRHPDSCSDRLKSTAAQRAIAAGEQPRPFGTPGFLFLDPPDHTRLRRLVSKAFSPRVVKALEPDITGLVDDLLDRADEAGQFDAVEALAHPLPVAVICRLLGVPIEDEPQFSAASTLLAQGLDPFVTFSGEAQGLEERMAAGLWLRGYLRELLERRRSQPADDLMSALISVEESGDQLTEEEIVATCNLLLIAGHETTVNLIANGILAMLRNREHWMALSADPSRVSAIIEETLRYDPPVQLASRVAGADMEIGAGSGGQERSDSGIIRVPKGDIMMVLLAAAHRDPAVAERPDEFDPTRGTIRHLAFGHGPHFCLGAPLARMEAAVALSAVTKRFPDARLADEPIYKPHVTLRGMARLDVAVG
ncbi:cytochrome P450 [Mycolicibacterium helvum]|uniref:Steroid C26-monooxygenase n=1 Tax=Mycolicibacterium helvum TaxID=1534349 RepID=A0A7I7T5P2_9MYCO|nr:cytochrome P450 [Mycolicibacterium helvum]BBY64300.1 cytochrome P450 [Mycolicibacterium helvum]